MSALELKKEETVLLDTIFGKVEIISNIKSPYTEFYEGEKHKGYFATLIAPTERLKMEKNMGTKMYNCRREALQALYSACIKIIAIQDCADNNL